MSIRVSIDNASFNIVDDNNVMVGYTLSTSCCEFPSAHTSSTSGDFKKNNLIDLMDLLHMSFDPDYYKIYTDEDMSNEYDCGFMAEFRLVNYNSTNDAYVCIHNEQNGYYSHGFKFQKDDQIIFEGIL